MSQWNRRSAANLSKWNIKFTRNGADDINYWRDTDKKKFERIRQLLLSIEADPLTGIGKPERLRHHKDPALYSRRIDQSHRLVYSIQNGEIIIYAARYHYGDK